MLIGRSIGCFIMSSALALTACQPITAPAVSSQPCTPTPAMPAGPNYIWNTPERSSVGEGHILTGVIKGSPDCSPIAHAKLEFWLAGPDGQYDDAHRATVFTDSLGAYRFESNYPGSYPERPVPHIHIFISAPGYRSLNTEYHPPRGQTAGTFDPILAPAEAAALPLPPDRPLVSMAGRIAFHSQRNGNMDVYVMNADGSEPLNLTNQAAEDWFPVWSPDGTQIAFVSDRTGNPDLYLMNADGSAVTNLTNHPAEELDHAWSPDGARLAFASNRDGDWELYLIELESRNMIQLTNNRTDDDWAPAWSPDGAHIAFSSRADIWVMNADGSEPVNLTNSPAEDDMPAWSPDGAQLMFSSTRDGNWELYLMNTDGTGLRRLTDLPSEDSFPTWSPDGTRIAFKSDRDGNYDIYVMNADGSGVTRLTDDLAGDGFPAWQPAQP